MQSFFRISQSHLNLLEICPPQFQKVYLDKLTFPVTPQQEEKTNWGSLFHLLMQQINLGLSLDLLLIENQELKNSVQALIRETSEIWNSEKVVSRDAEHHRNLKYNSYLLTVIYDLLLCYPEKAVIYDWKTYLKPEDKEKLAKNWQTKLYLYVLAETSNYEPEDISMTYWFVKLPHKPENITFNYSRKKHQQTQQDLDNLCQKLTQYLDEYINKNKPFPHYPNCETNCPYSQKLLYLEPNHSSSFNLNELIGIDNIEEINVNL